MALVVRYARKMVKEVSQGVESRNVGISVREICLIEHGRLIPTKSQAQRLSAYLGVPADRLLEPAPSLETVVGRA
jgi:transcriptional regulator with XRE-family HTH domain